METIIIPSADDTTEITLRFNVQRKGRAVSATRYKKILVQTDSNRVYAMRADGVIDTWNPALSSNWSRHYSLKAAISLGVLSKSDYEAYKQAEKARETVRANATDAETILSLARELGVELTNAQVSTLEGIRDAAY